MDVTVYIIDTGVYTGHGYFEYRDILPSGVQLPPNVVHEVIGYSSHCGLKAVEILILVVTVKMRFFSTVARLLWKGWLLRKDFKKSTGNFILMFDLELIWVFSPLTYFHDFYISAKLDSIIQ